VGNPDHTANPQIATDPDKLGKLVNALRHRTESSRRQEKFNDELLDHYQLAQGSYLTHLGILCLGQQHQRAQLTTAPVIQFINTTSPARGQQAGVGRPTLNPMELIEAVWLEVPTSASATNCRMACTARTCPPRRVVVRELLVNALVLAPTPSAATSS